VLIPEKSNVEWAKEARENAAIINAFYRGRIKEGTGWWIGHKNPYVALLQRYNLLCGRSMAVDMLGRMYSGGTIVDLGGGEGYVDKMILDRFPDKNFQVVLQDMGFVILAHGKERSFQNVQGVDFVASDSLHSGFKAGIFDCAISTECIEHIRDLDLFFAEANRILKPGGRVFLTTPNKQGIAFWLGDRGVQYAKALVAGSFKKVEKVWKSPYGFSDGEEGYEKILSSNEVVEALKKGGFIIEQVIYNQFLGNYFIGPVGKFIGFNQVVIARKVT